MCARSSRVPTLPRRLAVTALTRTLVLPILGSFVLLTTLGVARGRAGEAVPDCIADDRHYPHQLAAHHVGTSEDLDVEGTMAYVAVIGFESVPPALTAVDISTPSEPRSAGYLPLPVRPRSVDVEGDHAYIVGDSADDTQLLVIDVSSSTFEILSTMETAPGHIDVDISGHHAFLAGASEGMQVVDIAEPAAPRLVATGPPASRLVVDGGHVFSYRSGALKVVDVSTPEAPELVGELLTPHTFDMAISGSHAYLAGPGGVTIVDVSTPAEPIEAGWFGGSWATGM